jgi:quercetin dioxygenase-like cupin family protein
MRFYSILLLFFSALLSCLSVTAQVQVSKEPFHKPVIENKYIRLLDVWLQPKDTTQFHIHSTPSVFLYFTKTNTGGQVRSGNWTHETSVPGKTWYRSFIGDTLVHRVCNADSVPFHVTDVELLSSYKAGAAFIPLPFDILFENEKVIAYLVRGESLKGELITDRGPLVAELVEGELVYDNLPTNEKIKLKAGEYLYIAPGTHFNFFPSAKDHFNLVLFELK